MRKILSLIVLSLFIAKNVFADNEMPEKARPDDKTISLYEYKKKIFIKNRRDQGRAFSGISLSAKTFFAINKDKIIRLKIFLIIYFRLTNR